MRSFRWQVPLTVVCILLGVLLSLELRAQASLARERQDKNATIITVITELENESSQLEEQIGQLRLNLQQLQQQGHPQLQPLREALLREELHAGLVTVHGPGISVTLDDNKIGAEAARKDSPSFNPEDYIIHDKDILYLVNELKQAGAEAIAINNQRLVATSEIRCVGPVVFVNSAKLAPPYEIKAIGDPEYLALTIQSGETYPFLQSRQFPVALTKVADLTISAYKGSYQAKYLLTPQEGEEE